MPPELQRQIDRMIDVNIEEGLHPELRWTDAQWAAYEKQQDSDEDRANDYDN